MRTLIEVNHDYSDRLGDGLLEALGLYLASGSSRDAEWLEHFGFRVISMRHHSGQHRIDARAASACGLSTTDIAVSPTPQPRLPEPNPSECSTCGATDPSANPTCSNAFHYRPNPSEHAGLVEEARKRCATDQFYRDPKRLDMLGDNQLARLLADALSSALSRTAGEP